MLSSVSRRPVQGQGKPHVGFILIGCIVPPQIDDLAFTAFLGAPVPHLALLLLPRVLLQLLSYPTELNVGFPG